MIAAVLGMAMMLFACSKDVLRKSSMSIDTSAEPESVVSSTVVNLIIYIVDSARPRDVVARAADHVRNIFEDSCNLKIDTSIADVETSDLPGANPDGLNSVALRMLTEDTAQQTLTPFRLFFISSTLENNTAFAYLPSANIVESGTAWVTSLVTEDCLPVIMAHETGHLLLDDAGHSSRRENIMHHGCTSTNFGSGYKTGEFNAEQCRQMEELQLLRSAG